MSFHTAAATLWLVLTVEAALGAVASPIIRAGQTLKVGTLVLKRCAPAEAWCGTLVRALDPHGGVPGTVPVYFEYYPHSGPGPARSTLVATEGGPGYPASESRDSYLALYKPLRTINDVLLMDNRGTGRSGAVDCPELQRAPSLTLGNVAACGRLLGSRAPLYSTTLAVDDLAAVLDALAIGRIDLYGDSYGTFFAQVFAVRHGEKLRSVVLDGAYPLGGGKYAWYPDYAPAMRDKFNFSCQRSAACSQFPGNSMSHFQPAIQQLRSHPFEAQARDVSGKMQRFTANASQLALVMFAGVPARASIREGDAAARAFVAGDREPLLRLMAESQTGIDSRDEQQSPTAYSAGLAAAVMCQDAPQIYDMSLDIDARMADRVRAIKERQAHAPQTYAPFTIDEYRGMPLDYAFIDECVQWPKPPASYPAGRLTPGPMVYPKVPALIVSGDLDNMTSVADGAAAAAHFPHGRQAVFRNSLHVNALPRARSECGATVVRHFLETLEPGDLSCAQTVSEIRLVPRFARHWKESDPASAGTGNRASVEQLRAVSTVLLTAGDAMVRSPEVSSGAGVGLRGGTFRVREIAGGYEMTLHELRWSEDLIVSGTVDFPRYQGAAHASLHFRGGPGMDGNLKVQWQEGAARARAHVQGTIDGRAVAAELPAP